ncbi:MAG: sulfur carrier protein ThiS [Terriglobales bacterium]
MQIAFNGRHIETQAATLAALLLELGIGPVRVAVERNRELVPKRLWAETQLDPGDVIEVVQMVGGGSGECGRCRETSARYRP